MTAAEREEMDRLRGALSDLVDACTDAYKAGRIPAEPFVRARNVLHGGHGTSRNPDAARGQRCGCGGLCDAREPCPMGVPL